MIRIAVVEDRPLELLGYRARLMASPDVELVGLIVTGDELLPFLEHQTVDVLILDVGVPTSITNPTPYPLMHLIPKIQETYPEIVFLIVSNTIDRTVIRSILGAGANGYIAKDDVTAIETLPEILKLLVEGGFYVSPRIHADLFRNELQPLEVTLTPRQKEALALCGAYPHLRILEISKLMGVSHSTARNLLSAAYLRLGVPSRQAAVIKAQQVGLISPADINPSYPSDQNPNTPSPSNSTK